MRSPPLERSVSNFDSVGMPRSLQSEGLNITRQISPTGYPLKQFERSYAAWRSI